ncbi:VOC family protein [Sneathiella glossodoripedis]|uniref:VOC family protein n=1 Tax=Sneathiella glossodoripedis TaxID=418853 RepID=UPI000471F279|nr:VOC family protein [Sneathiella glossodoripedis]
MTVKRIVPNFKMPDPQRARDFYEKVLGLEVVMDLNWILTFACSETSKPQISIAAEGGNGTDVPDVSIEVTNVDETYEKARKFGAEIVYDICDEEWGVRRFYVKDPTGKILNIISHK